MYSESENFDEIKIAVEKCIKKNYANEDELLRLSEEDYNRQQELKTQINRKLSDFIPHVISLSVALYTFATEIPELIQMKGGVVYLIAVIALVFSVCRSFMILASGLTKRYQYKDSVGTFLDIVEVLENEDPALTAEEITKKSKISKIAGNIRVSNLYLNKNKEKQKDVNLLKNWVVYSAITSLVTLILMIGFKVNDYKDVKNREKENTSVCQNEIQPVSIINTYQIYESSPNKDIAKDITNGTSTKIKKKIATRSASSTCKKDSMVAKSVPGTIQANQDSAQ